MEEAISYKFVPDSINPMKEHLATWIGDLKQHRTFEKENIETQSLEQRVTALENLVSKIIALPQLSNLAGRDSSNLVTRLKTVILSDKKKLETEVLTDVERKEIERRITLNEYLVSPTLNAMPRGTATTESPNEQEVHAG